MSLTAYNIGKGVVTLGKKITRNDVAKLAGVSPALVSYVMNQTKPVSEEKTLAVRESGP